MAGLEIQNNPSPSLLMVEVDQDAIPDDLPAAGQRRLVVGLDHLFYLVDDAGVATPAGGDLAGHLADASGAHAASAIAFTPNGSIAATDVQSAIQEVRDEAAAGGAPSTADYLVGTAQGGLSAEIVVGATPGGELGGTWASPTVDATHAGSAHIGDHTHAATGTGSTGGGDSLAPATLNATGLVMHSGRTTATIDADQNDYSPANLHAIGLLYLNSFTANRTFTGLNAGTEGEMLIIQNNTGFSLLLAHESASSSAGNRFRCPNATTHTIRQRGSALLVYIQGRWCVIAA